MCEGEFIARMDGDDIALPDRFERQSAYLRSHPECVVVGGQALRIDSDGWPVDLWAVPCTHEEIDGRHINGAGGQIIHPAAMIRRTAYETINGYRAEFVTTQDLDLWLRLAEVGQLANLPEPVLKYRLHLKSVTSSRRAEQREAVRKAVTAARERRGMSPANEGQGGEDLSGKPSGPAHERHKWVRRALQSGHYATARKHVVPLLREEPLRPLYWLQFVRATVGGLLKSDPMMPGKASGGVNGGVVSS